MSVFFLPASLVAQWSRILLQCRRCKRQGFHPWVGKIPWRRAWQPTAEFLPGESHGQRSLAGYSQQSRKESDMTEGVTCFSFSCFLLAEPMTSSLFFLFKAATINSCLLGQSPTVQAYWMFICVFPAPRVYFSFTI